LSSSLCLDLIFSRPGSPGRVCFALGGHLYFMKEKLHDAGCGALTQFCTLLCRKIHLQIGLIKLCELCDSDLK
jgi:hypothetical protein